MKEISVQSTSRSSATTDLIILRQTDRIRLVCKPLIVDNPNNQEASVKLTIIYQRKSVKDIWVDYKDINLSQLRTSEGVKLELKSEELLLLYESLIKLYQIFPQIGIPYGEARYIDANSGLSALLSVNEEETNRIFEAFSSDTSQLILRLLNWFSKTDSPDEIMAMLEKSDQTVLQQFNGLVGLSALKSVYNIWLTNISNGNEEFWQRTIEENSYILSQIFSFPVVVVKGKAYVGGKSLANTGGNLVDFLLKNSISKNTILIEIKTPNSPILGTHYRDNTYSTSRELSGAIIQVSNYKDSFQKEYSALRQNGEDDYVSFEPSTVVIIGNSERELDSINKKRSFELFRSHLSGVEVITYDELFGKIKLLIDLLEGHLNFPEVEPYEEIPF